MKCFCPDVKSVCQDGKVTEFNGNDICRDWSQEHGKCWHQVLNEGEAQDLAETSAREKRFLDKVDHVTR